MMYLVVFLLGMLAHAGLVWWAQGLDDVDDEE